MLMTILNVIYVLLAIGMIVMILMQRGAGAQAGSGFGGGASSTVFGSRGASNFLSKSTKWMAIVFFGISLFMAWYATHNATGPAAMDLGVMSQVPVTGSTPQPPPVRDTPADGAVPAAPSGTPPAASGSVPAAPAPASPQPTASKPVTAQPTPADETPAQQAPTKN